MFKTISRLWRRLFRRAEVTPVKPELFRGGFVPSSTVPRRFGEAASPARWPRTAVKHSTGLPPDASDRTAIRVRPLTKVTPATDDSALTQTLVLAALMRAREPVDLEATRFASGGGGDFGGAGAGGDWSPAPAPREDVSCAAPWASEPSPSPSPSSDYSSSDGGSSSCDSSSSSSSD
jgi:hypothetical protein